MCEKDYAFPGWILCVGALMWVEGCPGVRFGLASASSENSLICDYLLK
jgi:hypothetical protein